MAVRLRDRYHVGERVAGTLTYPAIDLNGIPDDSDIVLSFNYMLIAARENRATT